MRLATDGFLQLTYCTNIHPGNGWEEVLGNLRRYGPSLKAAIAPRAPFGLGLRLSSQESCELLQGDQLDRFKDFLDAQGLYVFLLNGFPYGPFHKEPVKEAVFAPDWRDDERVAYTLRLVEILARLLPNGVEGGISTSPLSYKPWVSPADAAAWEAVTRNIGRVAAALMSVKERQGKWIHLDIEPEPDGLVENSAEVAPFMRSGCSRWARGNWRSRRASRGTRRAVTCSITSRCAGIPATCPWPTRRPRRCSTTTTV